MEISILLASFVRNGAICKSGLFFNPTPLHLGSVKYYRIAEWSDLFRSIWSDRITQELLRSISRRYYQKSEKKRTQNSSMLQPLGLKEFIITFLLIYIDTPSSFFISKFLPLGLYWARFLVLIPSWEGSVSIVAPMIANNQPNFNMPVNISSFNRNDVYTTHVSQGK